MWWVLFLAGCSGGDAELVSREEAVRDEMSEHWAQARDARDAAIDGDLATVKEQVGALVLRLPVAGLPEEVTPLQERLAIAAGQAAQAEDLTTAALALGDIARTCGECHSTLNAELGLEDEPPPEGGEGVKAEMARHKWAADRMWVGLIRADDEAFAEAVHVMSEAPLVPSGTRADSPLPPLATELELGVHELAVQAKMADDPAARGKKYGEMLVTCATCHKLLRDD